MTKKIIEYVKHNYKYSIFFIILTCFNGVLLFDNISQNKYDLIFFVISVIIEIIGIASVINNKLKIEKVFLMIAIPIGLLYIIFMPIGKVPDEANHFLRAYEIAEGKLISELDDKNNGVGYFTDDINKYIINRDFSYEETLNNLNEKNEYTEAKYAYTNTSIYSFLCYIPQALGILIAKIFGMSILLQAYFARLFNFIIWVLMTYFAIKLLPIRKLSALIIASLPMVMQQVTSISADCITIATSFLLISYILNLRLEKKGKITLKQELFITILCVIISLCKIVYLPFVLITLLIPVSKFKNRKQKVIKIGVLILITVLLNILWLGISSRYLADFKEGTDAIEQAKYVISNPIQFIVAIGRTLNLYFQSYIFNLVGSNLGWFDINLSNVYVLLIIIFMSILFLIEPEKEDKAISTFSLFVISFVGLAIVGLIFTSLYLQWNTVQSTIIEGIQGRYFIPVLLLIPLVLSKFNVQSKFNEKYMYILIYSFNIYALNVIFSYFI